MPRRPKTIGESLDGIANNLRTQRQNASKLAAGELTEAQLDRMAVERLLRERGVSNDDASAHVANAAMARGRLLGSYTRDAGEPLFPEPWYVSGWVGEEPGVDDDPAAYPARTFDVIAGQRDIAGRLKSVIIDLEWTPWE